FLRWYYLGLIGWLLVLGSVAVPLKPQLELDRMLIVASLLGCIPAGYCIRHLLDLAQEKRTLFLLVPGSLILGYLFAGPFVSASFLRNRTLEQYYFRDETVPTLISFLQTQANEGRILFAGCVVHELSHGHLAPLTLYSNTPLIASSHVHNLWRYRDVFPVEALAAGDQGKQAYMNSLNVTGVLVHDAEQRAYFRKKPEFFEETWHGFPFTFFKRKSYVSNYFLEGQGTILQQTNNQVHLNLDSDEGVIKFRYFPFLTSDSCTLSPYVVSDEVTLTKLSNCSQKRDIIIRAVGPLKRIGM
ncbi:MAG: hypothetical protein KDD62_00885, partial [Bdellovibrionales bacterium]|nr:hypothetical protein [Bdellovibrionales bacterium]